MSSAWLIASIVLAAGAAGVALAARAIEKEVAALRRSAISLRDTRAAAERLRLEAAEAERRRRRVAESLGQIPHR
jgi:hypothetical protein